MAGLFRSHPSQLAGRTAWLVVVGGGLGFSHGCGWGRAEEANPLPNGQPVALQPVVAVAEVVSSVALQGICEPSGAVAAPDGSVWLADDDQDGIVFRWSGGVEPPLPVALSGDDTPWVQDMEGLSWRQDRLWILGSHSRTKKGKLKRRARLVGWMPGLPDTEPVVRSLWPDAAGAVAVPVALALQSHCAGCTTPDTLDSLNLEGMSWSADGEQLFVGLRAPMTSDGGAIVLALAPPTPADGLEPSVVGVHVLALGGRGVRGMTVSDARDELWILSGPSDKKVDGADDFALHAWRPGTTPRLLAVLPPLHGSPEAVLPAGSEEALLFLDEGRRLTKLDGGVHREDGVAGADFRCGDGAPSLHDDPWSHAVRVRWTEAVSPAGHIR